MRLREINLYRVDLPLTTPYRLSYRTFESFEPLLVELRDESGVIGWGEQHISPGSSAETREGGWAFARELAEQILRRRGRHEIPEAVDRWLAARSTEVARFTALIDEMKLRPENDFATLSVAAREFRDLISN